MTSYNNNGPNLNGLVLRATDPNNPTEDWDSIMQLSDYLCQNPDDYIKQILPPLIARLQDTNTQTVLYSLTLSDAIMKNTTDFVKNCFLKSDFLPIINGLSLHRNNEIKQKALEVIKENRIPQQQQQSSPSLQSTNRTPPTFRGTVNNNNQQQQQLPPTPKSNLFTYQEKLDSDLNIVKENTALLGELVSAASSPNELRSDDTALQLRTNCDEMNRRIIALIELIPEETVLLKLLEVHENLNDSLQLYDKFMSTGKKETPKATLLLNSSSAPPLSPHVQQSGSSSSQGSSSGFGALASRNRTSVNSPQQQQQSSTGGTLSLDDFLGSSVQPVSTTSASTTVPPPVSTNNKAPLSLDDLFGLTTNTTVQPNAPQQPMFSNNNNNQRSTYNPNNPYSDSMEREFNRLNISQTQPPQQPNNSLYPNVGNFNPYSTSEDAIDPNDPFGVHNNNQQQQQQNNPTGGFAALANRKKN